MPADEDVARPLARWQQPTALLALATWSAFYLGTLFAGLLHEVLGHGLTTWALGGRFTGFVLTGYSGYASCERPPNATALDEALISGGGNATTMCVGVLLLVLELRRVGRAEARLVSLALGATCLVSAGQSLVVWSFNPAGDSYRVVESLGLPDALRYVLVGAGGALLALVPIHTFRRLLVQAATLGLPLETFRRRLGLLLLLAGLPLSGVILAIHVFPVEGWAERLLDLGFELLLVAMLALVSWRPLPEARSRAHLQGVVVACVFALAVAEGFAFALWLGNGVSWGVKSPWTGITPCSTASV